MQLTGSICKIWKSLEGAVLFAVFVLCKYAALAALEPFILCEESCLEF